MPKGPRIIVLAIIAGMLVSPMAHAQIIEEEELVIVGTIESISPGVIVVKDKTGKTHTVRIQETGKRAVALADGRLLQYPADINVTGNYELKEIKAGQSVRFDAELNRLGRTQGKIQEILVVTGGKSSGITVKKEPASASDFATCSIVCQVTRVTPGRLQVSVPAKNGFTRKTALAFPVADDATVEMKSEDIRRATAGAKVTRLDAVRMNTGDIVASAIDVVVEGDTTRQPDLDDKLLAKYRHLSDEPRKPRPIRSRHFSFVTDVSDRQAQMILDKLETMFGLLTTYFGAAPTGVVEGFIVRDLSLWPRELLTEPLGVAKIREEAGVCFNSSLGRARRAVLYSCDDHGVIQHECTHGFCHLALGSTGPTWLAEGVAEMGQYWKKDQRAVEISPAVMSYIQNANPKRRLLEIAIPGRAAAGTWRDYAWRWALCHLLANNPNYSDRFKALAIGLMHQQEGVSFEAVYGPVAPQISFEYDQFLRTLGNGYRADLCAWDWRTKSKTIPSGRRTQKEVVAARGWQATGVQLEKGVSYDIIAVGEWKVAAKAKATNANGDESKRGQLIGAVFNNFKLSDPITIGERTRFIASADGHLFVRCQDDWNQLADNDGKLTVHFRKSPKE